jgi:DNA polymerase-3 subunit beta
MKLVIERGELLKALSHVTSVVERRTTIPILSNILLRASGGLLRFNATDLEREVSEETTADVTQDGTVTVPAHMLHDIVRKLPDGAQVELVRDAERERIALTSGQSRFALQTLPAEDFPDLAPGEMSHQFSLPAHELRRLIDRTRFAISTEETRYYLNGIFLHAAKTESGDDMLRAVATDGHRLARVDVALPEGAEESPGVIVPRKTVGELRKLLEDDEAEIEVSVSETKIRFKGDGLILTSKVIDGTFPDYSRVIPTGNTKRLEVDAAAFAQAVDRVATVSSERSRAVKLALDQDRLSLSVNAPDSGSATEELAVGYDDEPLEIGFNAKYLLEIAGQVDRENAVFMFDDPSRPTLVREGDDLGAVYVVMPMRV